MQPYTHRHHWHHYANPRLWICRRCDWRKDPLTGEELPPADREPASTLSAAED